MEFSYSQTENFEMGKLSSDTGYFKKQWRSTGGKAFYLLLLVFAGRQYRILILQKQPLVITLGMMF